MKKLPPLIEYLGVWRQSLTVLRYVLDCLLSLAVFSNKVSCQRALLQIGVVGTILNMGVNSKRDDKTFKVLLCCRQSLRKLGDREVLS